ncbi:hypothetical protein AB0O52_04315 [Arthrobacter sp. NPDC080073]|uniref:hypothetical protein n=1 Tax=Arthrobacter sp. NPDC080073 TaxID=3155919 RepID=UPI00342722D3
MINSRSFDLDSVRENEDRIFEHIGRFTVLAAHVDQKLSVLLAWMTGAADRKAAQRIFEGEQVSTKVRLLKRALPDDWPDKKRLLVAVDTIQKYRNSLTHSTVHSLLTVETGDVNYVKKREYQGGQIDVIDLAELKTRELRVSMLDASLLTLTGTFLCNHDIRDVDLRTLCFSGET